MFGFFSFYVSISKRYIIPPHGSNIREHWLHKRCAVNEACSNISFITLPEFCYKELNRTGESLDQVQGSSQWAAEEREFLVREKLSAVKAFSPLCSSANVFSAVCSPPTNPDISTPLLAFQSVIPTFVLLNLLPPSRSGGGHHLLDFCMHPSSSAHLLCQQLWGLRSRATDLVCFIQL